MGLTLSVCAAGEAFDTYLDVLDDLKRTEERKREREREIEEAEREKERRGTWIAENPPIFYLRSANRADEGVLRSKAVSKYNNVLSDALREK